MPNWSCSTDGDVGGHSCEEDSLFDFYQSKEDSSPSCKLGQPQLGGTLKGLMDMGSIISQIWGYSFKHKKS